MQHYLNQHELLKLNITDAKGSYDDSQLISKIFRGLPFRYNNFVDQYHLLNEDHDVKIRDITTKLLTYESKLLERDEEKRTNKADKDKKGSKGDDKGNDKSKKTCTYKTFLTSHSRKLTQRRSMPSCTPLQKGNHPLQPPLLSSPPLPISRRTRLIDLYIYCLFPSDPRLNV